jgi:single-strand DNA-binding protein
MINRVTLLGRIGKKEFKQTRTGSPLCHLSIATEEKYMDSIGSQKKVTTWHNVSFFSKLAEVADKYTLVGDLVYIEGKISNRKVVDDNGVNRMVHSVIGEKIQFLPRASKDGSPKHDETPLGESHMPVDEWDTQEVPF